MYILSLRLIAPIALPGRFTGACRSSRPRRIKSFTTVENNNARSSSGRTTVLLASPSGYDSFDVPMGATGHRELPRSEIPPMASFQCYLTPLAECTGTSLGLLILGEQTQYLDMGCPNTLKVVSKKHSIS